MKNRFKRTKVAPGISKRGKTYEATVNVGGKTYSAGTHPTINKAKDAQATRKAELIAHPRGPKPKLSDKTPFREYANDWVQTRMRGTRPFKPSMERTVLSHLRTLDAEIGDIRLRDFSPERLRQIEPSIASGKSPKYRKNVLQTMISVLEDAFKFGTLKRDVTVYFEYPKVPKTQIEATPLKDALKIVGAMRTPFNIAAAICALTGMRQGEVLALQWVDIDLAEHTITIRASRDQATGQKVEPKTEAGVRTVAIPPSLSALLLRYKAQRAAENEARKEFIIHVVAKYGAARLPRRISRRYDRAFEDQWIDFVFPARTQAVPKDADEKVRARRAARMPVLEARNLHREFARAREAQGVSIRWHDFRHTFASHILANGGEGALKMLQRQLGHTDARFTLAQYAHLLASKTPALMAPIEAAVSTGREAFDLAQLLAPGGKK